MASLITLTDPTSPAAEAFRTLRSNLQFAALDKPARALVVSSPAPEEGKSITAANLAIAMAQAGLRTILVDADLRRPSQHTLWKVPNDAGLTTLILANDLRQAALPLRETQAQNLKLLTSGPLPPNPADLIASQRMEAVMAFLAEQADHIVFDAPPVLAVTDALLLAARADGLLLVLKAGTTRRDHALRAKQALERANVRILGVALTNAPREAGISDYYTAATTAAGSQKGR
jgi:capsular exopolysaccharide synthesis family protein